MVGPGGVPSIALGSRLLAPLAPVLSKLYRAQPAAYMKICALLVPKEMKLEYSAGIKSLICICCTVQYAVCS